jgi:serine/threonine-protein kinase RsbT
MPHEPIVVAIRSDADIVTARQQGRALAEGHGFSGTDLTFIATAISEIARNIVTYAGVGVMTLRVSANGSKPGITVIAEDDGPGVADIALAMQDGFSTKNSLGLGLPGCRRLMDLFEITSAPGVGTTVTMEKWLKRR